MNGMLTTRQVAVHFGVSIYQVNYAINTHRLKAKKWGHIHVINEQDLPDQWPIIGRGGRKGE